ncbi:MAG: hypothetical protein H8K09_18610 [Nitrospira sp.]|nr:hypothetical protein [Nitrospira sp.]
MGKTDLIVSMKEECANSGNRAAVVQGDRPESPHMLAIGPLHFIHQAQGPWEWMGKGNSHGGETFGESLGQEVENVSAPGKAAAVSARLARGKQLALPFGHIGLNFSTEGFWRRP